MPQNTYEFIFSQPKDFAVGPTTGTFKASSAKKAQGMVFDQAARVMKFRNRKPPEDEVKRRISGPLRLTNRDTGETFVYDQLPKRRWWTEAGWERRLRRGRVIQEGRAKQPFRILKESGLRIPGSPLKLHTFVLENGEKPQGSGGFASYLMVKEGEVLVSDSLTTGRFWPARWDADKQRWIAIGEGVQLREGKVVERFPIGEKGGEVRVTQSRENQLLGTARRRGARLVDAVANPRSIEGKVSDVNPVTFRKFLPERGKLIEEKNGVQLWQAESTPNQFWVVADGIVHSVFGFKGKLAFEDTARRSAPKQREGDTISEMGKTQAPGKPTPQGLTKSQAQTIFKSRSPRSQAADGVRKSKTVAPSTAKTEKDKRLQDRWAKDPSRSDFAGVDTKRKGIGSRRKM